MELFHTLYSALRGTPLWVWAVFIWLMYRGITALKARITSVYSIFLMPLIFTGLSIQGLLKNALLYPYLLWIGMLLVGTLLGWLISRSLTIAADKKQLLVKLPGSPISLIIILAFFSVKYYFGYTAATDPVLAESIAFISFKVIVYGASCGVSLGRSLTYFYKYLHTSHTDLKP